ncbi:glycoside hydrolase family 38 [Beutenbergia cavernae DSM 12333]|uniref:Glycoside hydrolase family 38 n=1 Tax=Beutenbergia cavernae (strain ATCC BAA-8 / DSM 12333 / CCUG 43141 / JCM 11478 / NBRC 16432 / NCIMB 13614 / HKI 0122) TaxID=471853 RepID=C5C3P8_BEUC1|nr:glycoside hydrolase [Beutenbergia cavernae]ACQ81957.1 glycoside hydrolase family 38 [Beutenbergia cavernae DSM 12333]
MLDIDRISVIPTSHLDLFWLGDYRNCLARGDDLIRRYLDRAEESGDETFVVDTAIFAEHFLRTHPHYEPLVRRLLAEGRLEIGGAYIDRWENLVLGESIIRNIQIGRRWAKERLGIETRLAAHPDLPGLNAQTSQLYAQAGVEYYVTSRKVFHEGRIWRHVAPDGTALHMLTWPVHYVFVPFLPDSLEPTAEGLFTGGATLSHEDLRGRYPHGTVAMSGSAGDLTGPEDFITRYGKDQRAYIEQYRGGLPEVTIDYAVPATVMQPYLDDPVPLLEHTGSFPSVWGVAPDEEMRFFHRVRALERDLLDAETAAVLAAAAGRTPLPESASRWRGLYGEDAFFATDDLAPSGREFEWLWRMHVFTQDHNGGGEDGALSVFQKKVRHDRARVYAREVLAHAASSGGADRPLVLTTRFGGAELLVAEPELTMPLRTAVDALPADHWQEVASANGDARLALLADVPADIGLHELVTRAAADRLDVREDDDAVVVATAHTLVHIDRATGATTISDPATGTETTVAELPYAVRELGNDVTLATDESERTRATLDSVRMLSSGPLCAQVLLGWDLLGVRWRQVVTTWAHNGTVDVDIDVEWPALEDWQVRLPMLGGSPRSAVRYGTPFHGSDWDAVPDGSRPFQRDEISPEDRASYREVQHWVAGTLRPASGPLTVAVLTEHPAFRSHDGETSAVLLRTPASCGDRRLHWTNPGRTTWQFQFQLVPGDDPLVPARLADERWRAPRVVLGAAQPISVLGNAGDDVRVSALFLDEEGAACVRLVNQSETDAAVVLTGTLARDDVALVDLQGVVVGNAPSAGGRVNLTLPPWRVQTVRLARPA